MRHISKFEPYDKMNNYFKYTLPCITHGIQNSKTTDTHGGNVYPHAAKIEIDP